MSSQAVAKGGPKDVAQPRSDHTGSMEEYEHSATASASAGLNLNIFGAVAGAFSGKSAKKTEADGSSIENREDHAHIKGAGAGKLNAAAAANAEEKGRQMRQAIKEERA